MLSLMLAAAALQPRVLKGVPLVLVTSDVSYVLTSPPPKKKHNIQVAESRLEAFGDDCLAWGEHDEGPQTPGNISPRSRLGSLF